MENYLLDLIKQKLTKNAQHVEISNESIKTQLQLAAIDLTKITEDITKLLDLTDDEKLTQNQIQNQQTKLNVTDNQLLAYLERKQYAENSLPKLRDRIKITKKIDEIAKENSFLIRTKKFPRPHKESKSKIAIVEKAKYENDHYILKPDYITAEPYSCLFDVKDLKKILLKDLIVNYVHFGHFLECTVISKAFYITGINLLVKDITDQIENVVIYNYEAKSSNIDPSQILPIGTKLIIKEPFLQSVYGSSEEISIRVNSPTDIIIESYECKQTKIDLKQQHLAIRIYSKEIEKTSDLEIYLKRAQLYFNLEKFNLAFQDAQKATLLDSKNGDAYFIMGKSLYSMRKYDSARQYFKKCLKLKYPNARIEFNRTESRINEAKTGVYDIEALIAQYLTNKNLNFDIADYQSDKIEIADIANKSKGVKAVDFIPKGTLIVVSKAVTAVLNNITNYKDKGFIRVHVAESIYEKKDTSVIISDLVYKMQNDPDLATQIYCLYGGLEYNRDDANEQKYQIDILRIENILAKNSFDVKNYLEAVDLCELQKEFTKQLKSLEFTVNQFDQIDLESLNFESETYKELFGLQIKHDNLNQQRGLWLIPSYFNHSCIGNSFHICIGDMMMIYTRRDIYKDEELTLNYLASEQKYSIRLEKCLKTHQFKCDCELCALDEQDTMRDVREQFLKTIFSKSNQTISEALADVNKMRCTYMKRPSLHVLMIYPLEILAAKYRNESMFKESAKCYEEIFETIKNCSEFVSLAALKEAYNDYLKCSLIELSESCKTRASDYFVNFKAYFDVVWDKIRLVF